MKTLNNLINLRGQREQAFKFAVSNFKGGMKQCFTRGCQIFVPITYSLKNIDISDAILVDRIYNGEEDKRLFKLV